jgi:hypothetical protein
MNGWNNSSASIYNPRTLVFLSAADSAHQFGPTLLITLPPLQTCQNGYDRASIPWHTPLPPPSFPWATKKPQPFPQPSRLTTATLYAIPCNWALTPHVGWMRKFDSLNVFDLPLSFLRRSCHPTFRGAWRCVDERGIAPRTIAGVFGCPKMIRARKATFRHPAKAVGGASGVAELVSP